MQRRASRLGAVAVKETDFACVRPSGWQCNSDRVRDDVTRVEVQPGSRGTPVAVPGRIDKNPVAVGETADTIVNTRYQDPTITGLHSKREERVLVTR